MTSLLNKFRAAAVALSIVALLAPANIWAKSPGGATSHITSQARVASSSSTATTIHSSNGMSSDKVSNLSVSSGMTAASQPGGGHFHPNSTVASSTIGSSVSKASQLKSPWDSVALPTGGGSVKGVAGTRSLKVMDSQKGMNEVNAAAGVVAVATAATGGAFVAVTTVAGTGLADGIVSLATNGPFKGDGTNKGTDPNHLTNGNDSQCQDGGVMGSYHRNPDGSAGKPVGGQPISMTVTTISATPGSSKSASIANSNAKFVNPASYLKNSPMISTASNAAATKWNATHIAGQVAKGDQTNSEIAKLHQSPVVMGPNPQPIEKPKHPPMPMPYPSGSVFGGGYSDEVSPAAYTSDDSAVTPITDASATIPLADSGIDLVLEDIKLSAADTLVAGPAYTVTFRNQGTADAGKFQVAIAAGFNEQLKGNDPKVAIEIPSLAAGEAKQVTLRLPHKALLVEDNGKGLVPFRYLTVAIDATKAVPETDKTNNTAVIEAATLEGSAAVN